ncbi:hypothetical protein Afil01_21810 [Actinorhabdospora filicis]|uniref:Small RNA 2'-O-methyltransferase n=1 Tax=Actinorhabdospora filicis TaxID=1785913 RepID=A0A9W6W899_9ACTN|nr:hypothetical protein Afil01_21810 [Actinorhabdospora filicis]
MLLTISTTHRPATDLGHLLMKHPDKVQSFDTSAGPAYVCYPQADDERCTAALVLDVDPVALARRRDGRDFTLGRYVNDRPYAASSLLSVALGKVFGTALSGRSKTRPDLAATPIPLDLDVPVLRGTAELCERLFAPLGWTVTADALSLDPDRPEWGDAPYVHLRLTGVHTVAAALGHLYVLLPVLDDAKHYWVTTDEVEKLLRAGAGWLATHPARDLITRRYLKRKGDLVRAARAALLSEEIADLVDPTDSPDGPNGTDTATDRNDAAENAAHSRAHDAASVSTHTPTESAAVPDPGTTTPGSGAAIADPGAAAASGPTSATTDAAAPDPAAPESTAPATGQARRDPLPAASAPGPASVTLDSIPEPDGDAAMAKAEPATSTSTSTKTSEPTSVTPITIPEPDGDAATATADANADAGSGARAAGSSASSGASADSGAETGTRADTDTDTAAQATQPTPRPLTLVQHRHRAVLAALKASGARTVADLGCGGGALLAELFADHSFTRVLGADVSSRALEIAERRLWLDRRGDLELARISLIQTALTYTDDRLKGFDAAVLMEVIEHLDEPRLPALAYAVLGHAAPRTVIVTTPNAEYNPRYEGLTGMRHHDHRFEWDRARFAAWCAEQAGRHGYRVELRAVGEADAEVGAPTQMAVFTKEADR